MMPSSLVWTISLPLLALVLVVSVFLWRKITDTWLIVLALVVCVMALVFVPLLRVLNPGRTEP